MPLAFVLINTEPAFLESLFEAVKKIDGVGEAYMVYGVYDVVAKVERSTMQEINAVVARLRSLEKVLSTQTLLTRS